jgi:hypothetical protein
MSEAEPINWGIYDKGFLLLERMYVPEQMEEEEEGE